MERKTFWAIVAAAVIILGFAPDGDGGRLYRWVDEDGKVHITDFPDPTPIKEEPKAEPEEQELKGEESPALDVPAEAEMLEEQPKTPPRPSAVPLPPSVRKPAPPAHPVAAPLPKGQEQAPEAPAKTPPSPPSPPSRPAPPSFPEPGKAPKLPDKMPPGFPGGTPQIPGLVGGLIGLLMGFMVVMLIIALVVYLFYSASLFMIAKKLGVSVPWLAFIPLVQVWTFVKAADKQWWWLLLLLLTPVGPFIGIYLWMCIAENLGKNKWLGLLMAVPFVNLLVLGYLAFSKGAQQKSASSFDADYLPELPGEPMDELPGEPMDELPGEPMDELPGEPMDELPGEPMDELPGEPMDELPGEPFPEMPSDEDTGLGPDKENG